MTIAPQVTLDQFELHGIQREHVSAVIQTVDHKEQFGLLGMSFLGQFQTRFDHQRHLMILEPNP